MSAYDYDVVVVGAGLAGLQTARLLGGRGVRVLLADRRQSVDRGIHTTGIFVRRTLQDFRLPDDCVGPAVRDVVLYSPAGRALPLASEHDEFRVGRMGVLYLRWLEMAMDAGVEWRPDTRCAGVLPNGAGSLVVLDRGGSMRPVRTRFVVGADGATSRIAGDLGLSRNSEWIVGVEDVIRGVRVDGPPCFHCWLSPELAPGYIAWVVSDGEEVHVGVGGHAERFRPVDALRRFRQQVDGMFALAGKPVHERRGGRIPVGGVLPRIAGPRGLLVGDAAGAVSPLTAGGLDPCLRLSELAAGVTARYLATGDEQALAPYDGARFRRHFRTRMALRRVLTSVRSPTLVELACAALRSPLLRPLAGGVFFGRGSFPDVHVDVDGSPPQRPSAPGISSHNRPAA